MTSASESDLLFYVMKPLAIFAISVVGFILVFRNKSKRRPLDFYTNPDWNFFMKKWWSQRVIEKEIKADQKQYLKELKQDDNEKPRPLDAEASSDSQMIFGQDSKGNSLLVKMTRRPHRIADVVLVLRLKDGREYTFPDHPETQVLNCDAEKFNAGGLSMECLKPFHTWRIRFNGILRRGTRSEWSQDLDEEQLVEVKFNFLWLVKSKPLFWPYDWSSQLMAESLASEPWRDGNWMRLLAKVDSCGYDQYGSMFGEIYLNGEEKEQFEVNLPGLRQRRWGLVNNSKLRRTAVIVGVCRDGMVFNVGAFSSTEGVTHAQFGNVLTNDGKVHAIEWTDFHLRDFAEHGLMNNAQTVRFRVGKRNFSVVMHVTQNGKLPLSEGNPVKWQSDCYALAITVNGEDGNGIAVLGYPQNKDKENVALTPQYKRVSYSSAKPQHNKFIYHFTDEDASSVAISGGKGASLALLTSISQMENVYDTFTLNSKVLKFTVPRGFVLSVSAMDLTVSKSFELNHSIEKLAKLCSDGVDFSSQCEVVQRCIEKIPVSEAIVTDVISALKVINQNEDARIAVRSSSVCEDGEDVSAAGQNETFLGLRSNEDVINAIRKCWASLYAYQSVHYRKQNIQPIRTGMAVVVQTMLAADCAGVLFSQNPISGAAKECLISANYGLGETVVSGEVDPDNYFVKRSYKDEKLTIVDRVCGKKGYKIQMSADNSVEKVEVDGNQFCLSDNVVLRLSEIAVILEKLYGNGRDIEWGLKGDQIYLLQSRPITSLNQFTDWELMHEFDSPFMSDEDLSTTGNVQEVIPGAICMLSKDILVECLEKGLRQQFETEKTNDVCYDTFFPTVRHHVLLDVLKLFFQSNEKEITLDKKISAIAVSGYDFVTPEVHQISLKRYPPNPDMKKKMAKKVFFDSWNVKKIVKRSNALTKSFNCQYSAHNLVYFDTCQALFDNLMSHIPVVQEICDLHNSTSSVSTFHNVFALMILANGKSELTEAHHHDIRLICSSAKDTVSADVPKKLEIMAKSIFLSGKKEQFCAVPMDDGVKWLEKNVPEIFPTFQTFIEQNKHRCYKEFDFSNITWGMRPGLVIEMLQAILKFAENIESMSKNNEVTSMSPAELTEALMNKPGMIGKILIRLLISKSQDAVQCREQTKSNFISIIHEFRLGFRHLGLLMTKEGFLPHQDLVFFLTLRELRQLFQTRDVQLVKKAARRQKIIQELNKDKYPDLLWGRPIPINRQAALHFESGTEIRGTSIYAGVVTGRACVIHDFSEVSKIQPGDILITYSTDIGWSPYFPILGGVVTEIGGLISHGAVVAREYGLPCVVAATNATDFFTFGETITLDAKNGIIFKGTGEGTN